MGCEWGMGFLGPGAALGANGPEGSPQLGEYPQGLPLEMLLPLVRDGPHSLFLPPAPPVCSPGTPCPLPRGHASCPGRVPLPGGLSGLL